MTEEKRLPVVGYEALYAGILKGSPDSNGYTTVSLCGNGAQRTFRVHTLVLN